jgi:hypothetical protein
MRDDGRKSAHPVRGEFTADLYRRCRNPHCKSRLAAPVDNPHKAFCTAGCHAQCVVCEKDKPAGRSDRKLCQRPKCRTDYRKNKSLFARTGPGTDLCRLSSRNAQSTGTKIADLADRKWRQIAGPELIVSAFHCAAVGAAETVEASRRINARRWREAGTLIGPSDPPVNLSGGYKFPNAPKLELPPVAEPTSARVADSSGVDPSIPDDLSVPDFLKVAS